MKTNNISSFILYIIISFILSTNAAIAQSPPINKLENQLNEISKKCLTENNIHGLSYCIVLPNNQTISSYIGEKSNNQQIDSTMKWMFASCTKNIIAATILSLEEEGKLSLNNPVSKYFTHSKLNCNYSIKDLLHHQTNYSEFVGTQKYFHQVINNSAKIWKQEEILDSLVEKSSCTSKQFNYCNTNYLVLGLIIEKITGNTLNNELNNRFFNKLRMQNTCMAPENYSFSQLAGAWVDTDNNGQKDDLSFFGKESLNATLSLAFGSGNIVSNTKDMAIWIKSLFNNKVISEKSIEKMKTHAPNSNSNGVFKGYGLGMEHIQINGMNHLGHSGHAIHTSSMFYNPELDIAIVLVFNESSENALRRLHLELFNITKDYCNKTFNTQK